MKITSYKILTNEYGQVAIVAKLENGSWFTLPPKFPHTKLGITQAENTVFNLTEYFGLPVDSLTIMNHFNKELLEPDYKQIVIDCQKVLARYIEPGGITGATAIAELLWILDNEELVKKMKQ